MGWVRCVRCKKLQCDFVGRTFMHLRNDAKCTQILQIAPKHQYRIQWVGLGTFVAQKSKCDMVARTFALIATVQYVLHQVSCSYETIPNAPKYYKTDRNISSGPNGVDGVRWLRKITTRLRGTNFWNKFHAVTKQTQMHPNTTKRTETLVSGPMWWIGCVRCKKSRRDFVE